VTLQQGWESEAQNWAHFARMPDGDKSHELTNKPVLLEVLPPPGRATLDLACGEGRLSRLLRSLGHRVVGLDGSPTMARLAATHEDRSTVLLANGGELPFAHGAFDLVVAYMCLQDFDDMPRAVTEIARVLETAGRLCLAIPHPINTAGFFEGKDPGAAFVISGSYMEPARYSDMVEREGVRLTFHGEHRPLVAYTRALEEAGLLIEALREVTPPDSAAERRPSERRWQRVPIFLHLRAMKPR
jgi:SAM-dependent methyltransferase